MLNPWRIRVIFPHLDPQIQNFRVHIPTRSNPSIMGTDSIIILNMVARSKVFKSPGWMKWIPQVRIGTCKWNLWDGRSRLRSFLASKMRELTPTSCRGIMWTTSLRILYSSRTKIFPRTIFTLRTRGLWINQVFKKTILKTKTVSFTFFIYFLCQEILV